MNCQEFFFYNMMVLEVFKQKSGLDWPNDVQATDALFNTINGGKNVRLADLDEGDKLTQKILEKPL